MLGAVLIPILKLGKQTQQRLKTGLVCFSRENPGIETRARHALPCWLLCPQDWLPPLIFQACEAVECHSQRCLWYLWFGPFSLLQSVSCPHLESPFVEACLALFLRILILKYHDRHWWRKWPPFNWINDHLELIAWRNHVYFRAFENSLCDIVALCQS